MKSEARRRARRDKLVEDNLYIVAPIARMLAQRLPDVFAVEDLVGVGTIALIECADRYKPSEHGGAPFSAYARMRVRGAMIDSVKGRHFRHAKTMRSIDDENVPEFAQNPRIEEGIDAARRRQRIQMAIENVSPPSRRILTLAYQDGLRRREIAALCGLTGGQFDQLREVAIAELRAELRVKFPPTATTPLCPASLPAGA